ncbi:hypothetical protein SAMN05518672_1162 [Chitinophaga sp. CF118]|uniref:hypothetical protein n=1 Tax=Chitinophaga sp. CF118 TaxID=1884367 RepID=UPI0008EF6DC7|nr:hypothetical protein [Chitinophaga sp. CF118]SFF09271.1 hypothetical protein SAMN05518672_1162 [Chitinophaga sp. CF118]
MAYIDDALTYIQTDLTFDWATQYNTTLPSDNVDNNDDKALLEVTIAEKLDIVATGLFEQLNFSVLSGEYVSNIADHRQKVDNIENYIQQIANFDIPGFPNITLVAQELFQTNFYYSLRQTLKRYKSLLDFVESHLVYHPNTSQIFYVIKNDGDKRKDANGAAKQLDKLFDLNVELAQIDHSISFSKSYFTNLLLIQDQLKNFRISNTATELLLKKCGFLLYKISYRLKQSQKNYLYAIDFNYSTVQLNEIAEFRNFNEIIKGHYGSNFNNPIYDQRRDTALSKLENDVDLNLDDFHALIKYYKDDIGDLSKLKGLRTPYQQYYDGQLTSSSPFDKKALHIVHCYLENNILSLELDKKEFTLENWKVKLKEYTDKADTFKNKNFFPYYKILTQFLKEEISKQFKATNYDLNIISNLIASYKRNLTSLVENVGICEETDYLAFQNSYDGCKIIITDSSGTLRTCFISSSFVLPLNYKEIKEELESFKAELNKFNSMFEIQKMIDADRNDVKLVKQEIEKTDKRHIEILSIFAALVMFVSNEIQIFSKIPNMGDAVIYTLFFAYGLGLFVVMIWFITRPEGVKWKNLPISHGFIASFFLMGLVTAIVYVGITKFSKGTKEAQLEYLQFKIDSLQKAKVIDSLSTVSSTSQDNSLRAFSKDSIAKQMEK